MRHTLKNINKEKKLITFNVPDRENVERPWVVLFPVLTKFYAQRFITNSAFTRFQPAVQGQVQSSNPSKEIFMNFMLKIISVVYQGKAECFWTTSLAVHIFCLTYTLPGRFMKGLVNKESQYGAGSV